MAPVKNNPPSADSALQPDAAPPFDDIYKGDELVSAWHELNLDALPLNGHTKELFYLIMRLSSEFIDLSSEKIDERIHTYLRALMKHFGTERIMISSYNEQKNTLHTLHSIAREGMQPIQNIIRFTPAVIEYLKKESVPLIAKKQSEMLKLIENDLADIADKKIKNVTAFAMFPMKVRGRLVGALSYGTSGHPLDLRDAHMVIMRYIAEVLAKALDRKMRDECLSAAYHEISSLKQHLSNENIALRQELDRISPPVYIVGNSPSILKLLADIETVAPSRVSVLIWGETGTGKELIAKQVHSSSPRHDKRLVTVNCGAIPSNLFESEFFGRQKGAYTGADDSAPGKFELAHGSTLFLDEVGELPLEAQAKLLRVLQEGEFERLGSNKPIKVDVRIVAATNRDLALMVQEKRFREDLFFRLNVFPLTVPPLRERKQDIPDLVWYFVHQAENEFGKIINNISDNSMQTLQNYSWPGNIRELKNVVARSVIMSHGETLRLNMPTGPSVNPGTRLADMEREHILQVLEESGWVVGGQGNAADRLGLKRGTLFSRMKKMGIERPKNPSHLG